jgi:hypothetical protein
VKHVGVSTVTKRSKAYSATMNINNLKFHELANLFPLLEGEEFQKIVDDIKANGFRPEKITLLGGQILDGRNRYNAAKLAGHQLQPKDVEHFEERYPGQDPLAFVLAKNLHRRQLTVGQRACLAAELYKRMPKRPVGQPREISGIPENTPTAKESLEKAAEMAGVSVDSVQQLLCIEKVAPKVAAQVKTGKMSLHAASQAVKGKGRRNKHGLLELFASLWAKYPGIDFEQADKDQMVSELNDEKLKQSAVKLKKQFFALRPAIAQVNAEKEQSKKPQLLNGVFNGHFRHCFLPSVKQAVDRLVEPLNDDLAIDLYSQLREVERCLDRYPDQLPEAVVGLILLIRQYNPELAWTYPGDDTPVERTGEAVRF